MGLEDELNALLAGTAVIADGAKDATKEAKKIRRRSKDLEEQLDGMGSSEALGVSIEKLGAINTEDDLKKLFDEIDEDKSGTLEIKELQNIFKAKMNLEKSEDEIKDAFKEVGGTSESVTFEQFKKIIDKFKSAAAKVEEKAKE